MSEMVERVARAIYAAAWGFGHPPPTGVELEEARAQARAAIEAMREPTEAMEIAGMEAAPMFLRDEGAQRVRSSPSTDDCAKIFKAMIDTAEKMK